MDRLEFLPEQQSYGFTDPKQHKTRQLDGPMGFYTKDVTGQYRIVRCVWILSLDNWLDFYPFYKEKSDKLETFLIQLYVDSAVLTDYKAKFVQSSFEITEQSGRSITIKIDLEVAKA